MPYTEIPSSVTDRFEQTLASHNLHATVVTGEEFAPYADPTIDFFRKWRHPSTDIHSYVHDHYLEEGDGFRAALILDDADGVVGTHWSRSITIEALESESVALGSVAKMRGYLCPGKLQYAFASELLVRPDLQGQGLATGLRALTQMAIRESSVDPTMLISLICRQRGATEDNASERSARKVGLVPLAFAYAADRHRVSSRYELRYWYGVLRPGINTEP